MGGALFGYLEGHDVGHDILATVRGMEIKQQFPDGLPWYVVLENTVLCTVMGLTGGVALSCFGHIFLDCAIVAVESANRRVQDAGAGSSISGPMSKRIYYKRHDLDDHNRSTQKVAEKYEGIKRKEADEIQEILEIGEDGIRAKKLGKTVDNKNPADKTRGQ